jgi:pantoate--beta-alanine ligase
MWAFKQYSSLKQHLSKLRASGLSIGFVPTMGALHDGHLSLLRHSLAEQGATVCSIFVNPTQFNDPSDLEKYPRTEAEDLFLLERAGCDVVFLPSVNEVYPTGLQTGPEFSFGHLEQTMEGAFRPGHFKGVAQVVHRLLELVEPDALYMGQKDFQQVAIVREMIRQAGLNVRLVMCPTVREANGLARSSRNVRLSPEERSRAAAIFRELQTIQSQAGKGPSPAQLEEEAFQRLAAEPGFRPEYVKLVDGNSLKPIQHFSDSGYIVACAACWVGGVRLIDNLVISDW